MHQNAHQNIVPRVRYRTIVTAHCYLARPCFICHFKSHHLLLAVERKENREDQNDIMIYIYI